MYKSLIISVIYASRSSAEQENFLQYKNKTYNVNFYWSSARRGSGELEKILSKENKKQYIKLSQKFKKQYIKLGQKLKEQCEARSTELKKFLQNENKKHNLNFV